MVRFPPPVQTFPAASDGKATWPFSSPGLMQTASSVAIADRGSGMERPVEFRAAADGKRHVNKAIRIAQHPGAVRQLIIAAAVFLTALACGSTSHAQSGPFAGLAGVWSGGGNVTLDD